MKLTVQCAMLVEILSTAAKKAVQYGSDVGLSLKTTGNAAIRQDIYHFLLVVCTTSCL